MISSKYTIREQNEAQLLNSIIRHEEISRAQLAETSKLNKASVSAITKTLIADQLIFEKRVGDSSTVGGRKPIFLTLNNKAALLIALDLGFNYVDSMLAYLDGTVIKHVKKHHIKVSAANVLPLIQESITELLTPMVETPHGIIGMTCAIHGQVFENNILFTPYYDLDQLDLATALRHEYDFPIYLENEANLSALGEYTFSGDAEKLISISMHNGIGAGIVDHGTLQIGAKGKAGEIGHTIFQPHGKKCPCGNLGCLEQYGSNQVLYEKIATLKQLVQADSDTIKYYYDQDDSAVHALLKEYATILSVGVNNIIMMAAPEIVVINSSVIRKVPAIIPMIEQQLNNRFAAGVVIRNTTLQEKSTLFGGLAFVIQKFLNIQELKLKTLHKK
jgi:predicted NBD/HSP70 family sugar kinase